MKALGKCLICGGIIAQEQIPPEHAKIYLSITEIFIKHVSGKELTESSPLFPLHLLSPVFPFCNRNQCRYTVTTLYQNDLQIQSRVRRIQQIIGKSRALRSRCDANKNKITNCTKTKGVSSEFSETSGDESEASSAHTQDSASACDGTAERRNGRNSRPSFLKKKQQNNSLLLKPGKKLVHVIYLKPSNVITCNTLKHLWRARCKTSDHQRGTHADRT